MNYAKTMTGCLLMAAMVGTVAAQDEEVSFWPGKTVSKGLYVGLGFGQSNLDLGNEVRNEEGIDFTLKSTDDSDAATHFFAGYWILDHVGIELGKWDFGEIEQDFDFNDSRTGRSGPGQARVDLGGTSFSVVGAYDFKNVQLFGKLGYLDWDQDVSARFDVPINGQSSDRQELNYSGSSIIYGAGAAWNFAPGFWLRGDINMTDMDEDDLTSYGASIIYDFNPLLKALPDMLY